MGTQHFNTSSSEPSHESYDCVLLDNHSDDYSNHSNQIKTNTSLLAGGHYQMIEQTELDLEVRPSGTSIPCMSGRMQRDAQS